MENETDQQLLNYNAPSTSCKPEIDVYVDRRVHSTQQSIKNLKQIARATSVELQERAETDLLHNPNHSSLMGIRLFSS